MRLTFAAVSLDSDTLCVRFSYEPCKYDLRVLLTQWWLPMIIVSSVIDTAVFGFRTLVPALWVCAGITLLCGTVLYQVITRSFHVATYMFDRSSDAVRRNGILVSRLSEAEIVLQTRLGSQGNRRFRLILKKQAKTDISLTETPLLGDQTRRQHYYGQTHAENIQTMFCGWVADTGRRDAVDERDVSIFELARTLEDFVQQ